MRVLRGLSIIVREKLAVCAIVCVCVCTQRTVHTQTQLVLISHATSVSVIRHNFNQIAPWGGGGKEIPK